MLAHVYDYDIILLDVVLPEEERLPGGGRTPARGAQHADPDAHLAGRGRGRGAGARRRRRRLPRQAVPVRGAAGPDPRAAPRGAAPSGSRSCSYGPSRSTACGTRAVVNGQPLDLTPKEFQLLEYFLLHPEEVVRRTTLLEKVWDMHFDPGEQRGRRARRQPAAQAGDQAAGETLICTVRGVGFVPPAGERRRGSTQRPPESIRGPPSFRRRRSPSSSRARCSGSEPGRARGAARVWMAGLVLTGRAGRLAHASRRRAPAASRPTSSPSLAIARRDPAAPAARRPDRRADADRRRGAGALRRGPRVRAVRELEAAAPRIAHRLGGGRVEDVRSDVAVGRSRCSCGPAKWCRATRVVTDGHSHVDIAALTGEPLPVSAEAGTPLMSGSLNLEAPLTVRATAVGRESQYARIVELVRTAQASKAPLQRLADRYAVWFTPLTLLASARVAWLVSPRPGPGAGGAGGRHALPADPRDAGRDHRRHQPRGAPADHLPPRRRARAARARYTVAVFDKTGTLTVGRPRVAPGGRGAAVGCERGAAALAGRGRARIGAPARPHPGRGRRRRGGMRGCPEARHIVEAPGQGVVGRVDGRACARSAAGAYISGAAPERARGLRRRLAGAAAGLRAYVAIDGDGGAAIIEYADAAPSRTSADVLQPARVRCGMHRTAAPLRRHPAERRRRRPTRWASTRPWATSCPQQKVAAVAAPDEAGRAGAHGGRRHQRRPGAEHAPRSAIALAVRGRRDHRGGGRRGDPGRRPHPRGRGHGHQPAHAAHRPPEHLGRPGAQRRRDGVRRRRA